MHPRLNKRDGFARYTFEESHRFTKCWPPLTPELLMVDTACNRRVWTWFEQNQSFVILGKTLDQWMRMIRRTFNWDSRMLLPPSLETVDAVLQWNMRLSVTQKGFRRQAKNSVYLVLFSFEGLVKIVPLCICFVTHLICTSPAKIKAAKSQICIIDRANINTREDTGGNSPAPEGLVVAVDPPDDGPQTYAYPMARKLNY